jgi:hypothetical protein
LEERGGAVANGGDFSQVPKSRSGAAGRELVVSGRKGRGFVEEAELVFEEEEE